MRCSLAVARKEIQLWSSCIVYGSTVLLARQQRQIFPEFEHYYLTECRQALENPPTTEGMQGFGPRGEEISQEQAR